IDSIGLATLSALAQLRILYLEGTRVTDKGIGDLTKLSELRKLSLQGTEVTDAILPDLLRLTKLRMLNVLGTPVTADGVKYVQDAMPGIRIIHPSTLAGVGG